MRGSVWDFRIPTPVREGVGRFPFLGPDDGRPAKRRRSGFSLKRPVYTDVAGFRGEEEEEGRVTRPNPSMLVGTCIYTYFLLELLLFDN